jgi:alanine racemase
VKLVTAILELPHLRLAGLCAHPHAPGGADPAYAERQLGRFTAVVDELQARGLTVPIRLLAASPFVLRFPQTYLNAVDPGRMLYGITFAGESPPVPLRPTLRALATRVIAVKELAPRERFAALAPFPVTAPMRLGVVPMGSADGLAWLHAGRVSRPRPAPRGHHRGRARGPRLHPLTLHRFEPILGAPSTTGGRER